MGPQLYSCGNKNMMLLSLLTLEMLQWGHNFTVAEIPEPLRSMLLEYCASMGPQLYSCGNPKIAKHHKICKNSFNGATTLQLRKFPAGDEDMRLADVELQWGHNFTVAEMKGCKPTSVSVNICFNGATTLQLRKLSMEAK